RIFSRSTPAASSWRRWWAWPPPGSRRYGRATRHSSVLNADADSGRSSHAIADPDRRGDQHLCAPPADSRPTTSSKRARRWTLWRALHLKAERIRDGGSGAVFSNRSGVQLEKDGDLRFAYAAISDADHKTREFVRLRLERQVVEP